MFCMYIIIIIVSTLILYYYFICNETAIKTGILFYLKMNQEYVAIL
jgi:hypothetical protein